MSSNLEISIVDSPEQKAFEKLLVEENLAHQVEHDQAGGDVFTYKFSMQDIQQAKQLYRKAMNTRSKEELPVGFYTQNRKGMKIIFYVFIAVAILALVFSVLLS